MNNTLTKNSYFKVSSEPGYDLFSLQLLGDAGGVVLLRSSSPNALISDWGKVLVAGVLFIER